MKYVFKRNVLISNYLSPHLLEFM